MHADLSLVLENLLENYGKVATGYLKLNLSFYKAPLFSPVKVLTVCSYVISTHSDFPLFPLPVSASLYFHSPPLPVRHFFPFSHHWHKANSKVSWGNSPIGS